MKSSLSFPVKSELLVPHRPPMLLVDYLLERSGDYARGEATLPDSGIRRDQDTFLPEFFVELVAQTSAMANGYDQLIAGAEKRDGMLVGVDSFVIFKTETPDRKLCIEAVKKFEFGPITLINGKVWAGDVLVAEGNIKVWENPDGAPGK